jgi:predicted Zn-dependent protease
MKNKMEMICVITIALIALSNSFNTPVRAEAPEQRVTRVCMSMRNFMDRPNTVNKITVDDSKEINAFADSNGGITFTAGMLDFVTSEAEIAIVCGHEMSHLSSQHIKRSLFTRVVAGLAAQNGGDVGLVAGSLLSNKQSRKHEREADRLGLIYMWQAGYDPRIAWRFWERMEQKFNQGDAGVAKYFTDHPVNNERIENFKVLPVRYCLENRSMRYCDEILNDNELVSAYKAFNGRD